MDIVLAVFLWLAPMALLLAGVAAVLRKALGRIPRLFYPGALLLCAVIVVWAEVWMSQRDGGLDTLWAWMAQVNAGVAAGLVAVAWVVHSIRARRT